MGTGATERVLDQSWPVPSTPILGRAAEIPAICGLLAEDATRLVTLTGPGGVGKTRVALAVLDELACGGTGDAVFVPLESLRDPDLLAPALVTALGLREDGGMPPLDLVIGALRERAPLLVLDNLEQIAAGAAPVIARLLAVCSALTILATSRVPLAIRGERQFPLDPLPLPDPDQSAPDDNPAVALFVERARAVRPDFDLSERNRADVVALCRRLDGLPLAIELAAARSKLLSPMAILARLTERLRVLDGGPRDLPSRQQTMHDAITWSYALLTPEQQVVFRRFAVFAGSCALPSAEQVLETGPGAIAALADHSLLVATPAEDGDIRVRMLQPIRDVALTLLAEAELAGVRARHAAHYLDLAEAMTSRLTGPEQARALARLETDHPDLRAALSWLLDRGDRLAALRLAVALTGFWRSRGYLRDAKSWLERALALPGDIPRALEAQAHNDLANVAADLGDYAQARSLYETSLELRRDLSDRRGIADALGNLGLLASDQRDYARARALLEESLAIRRELGDTERLALTLANLGVATYNAGYLDEARPLLDEARLRFAGTGDQRRMGYVLTHLGIVARRAGDLAASEAAHEEALAWYRACRNTPGVAGALNNLGRVALDRKEFDRAERHYEEALALQREIGNDLGVALVLANLAATAHERGDHERAVTLFQESLTLRWGKGDVAASAEVVAGIAGAVAAAGRYAQAARLLGAAQAVQAASSSEPPRDERVIAELRARLGEARFTAAVAEGRALAPELAVAEGLAVKLPAAAPNPAEPARPVAGIPDLRDTAGLTARELDVLRLVATGKTNAEIGEALFISPFTAKTHVANLLGKLGVENRAAASTWAAQHGLL